MKKIKLIAAIVMIIGAFVLMQSSAPPPPGMSFDVDPRVETLEQTPPQLKRIWVQKLLSPQNGLTMLVRLELDTSYCYGTIADTINIFWGDSSHHKITFYDNGSHGDAVAADGIFAAYVSENVHTFRAQVLATETALLTRGSYIKFTGHTGQKITDIPHFDVESFDLGASVILHPDLTDPGVISLVSCPAISREKSLFITDLSVVEDDARTYNVADDVGDPEGAWTFGQMFKNMTGTSSDPLATKKLLKSWVRHWTADFNLNGQKVAKRHSVFSLFIGPWLVKAGCTTAVDLIDETNWSACWDQATVTDYKLRKYAPFKLTAIVNRLDLRGNFSFTSAFANGGETRFIFTLVDYDGHPVEQQNVAPREGGGGPLTPSTGPRFLDWKGLNVIFEYGNVQNTRCSMKSLAQQWTDLSGFALGSTAYRDALQVITDYVTSANAVPSRPNGSALMRIRTNEKIFHGMESFGIVAENMSWSHSDWEFRQFELDPVTQLFEQVPLTNSVINYANTAPAMTPHSYAQETREPDRINQFLGYMADRINAPDYPYTFPLQENLTDWLFNPYVSKHLLRGNHNVPMTYRGHPFQASSALVVGEFSQYWAFKVNCTTPFYNSNDVTIVTDYPDAPAIRHQYAVNTCEGCHTGETKTVFTHVMPLSYGESARYWLPASVSPSSHPDFKYDEIDSRRTGSADAVPYNTKQIAPGIPAYELPVEPIEGNAAATAAQRRYYQNVSAYLTGMSYTGINGAASYKDDDNTDADDNNMDGLFHVYDPGELSSNTHGFNDLLRRRNDLCALVNGSCTPQLTSVLSSIKFIPLPLGSH